MSQLLPSRGDIVRCLTDAHRALHAREISSRCEVRAGLYHRLLELLGQLSFDGTVVRLPGNRFKAQPVEIRGAGGWVGVLSMHPRGFGFVAAAGQEDVYVAPDGIGPAMHGDHVRVTVIGRTRRGVEGRIEEVVERRNPRVAGVLRRRGKSSWLEPDDARVRGPVVVKASATQGRNGDAAVVSITRFPELAGEHPEGELLAMLGSPGDPKAEVAKILVREQIDEDHPDGAVREAEAMASKLLRCADHGRVDLRSVPLPTIDPEDARDHDDALWADKTADGYRIWVAIADVAEYVLPGTELDREARLRGCTIYLPDRAIPMLPAALAADLCSLMPDAERLCLCVIADLDKRAQIQHVEIVEGTMRSAAMLTYGGVARALGWSDTPPRSTQAEALKKGLRHLDELARKLRKKRLRRGALQLDLPEAHIALDEQTGAPTDVTRRAQDPGIRRAYQMVEELMLLANELVARWVSSRRCPCIYRVHGRPDEKKLERLGHAAERLRVPVELDALLEPRGVARWLEQIADHPRHSVLQTLLLRSLQQAAYDIVNVGHFGLASDAYLHFTSPIRRYPDVEVHRIVKHLLHKGKPDTRPAAIAELRAAATAASVRERAALAVEREVADLYRALLMQAHLGEVLEGRIAALVSSGLYATLDAPFVDVLVPYDALGADRYQLSDDELSVHGVRSGEVIALGDRIVVEIEDVSVLRRSVTARRVVPKRARDALARSQRDGGKQGQRNTQGGGRKRGGGKRGGDGTSRRKPARGAGKRRRGSRGQR